VIKCNWFASKEFSIRSDEVLKSCARCSFTFSKFLPFFYLTLNKSDIFAYYVQQRVVEIVHLPVEFVLRAIATHIEEYIMSVVINFVGVSIRQIVVKFFLNRLSRLPSQYFFRGVGRRQFLQREYLLIQKCQVFDNSGHFELQGRMPIRQGAARTRQNLRNDGANTKQRRAFAANHATSRTVFLPAIIIQGVPSSFYSLLHRR